MYSTPSSSTSLSPDAQVGFVAAVVPDISIVSLPTRVVDFPVALDVNVAPSLTCKVIELPSESFTVIPAAALISPAATAAATVYFTPF